MFLTPSYLLYFNHHSSKRPYLISDGIIMIHKRSQIKRFILRPTSSSRSTGIRSYPFHRTINSHWVVATPLMCVGVTITVGEACKLEASRRRRCCCAAGCCSHNGRPANRLWCKFCSCIKLHYILCQWTRGQCL